jgi:hypothetical protein
MSIGARCGSTQSLTPCQAKQPALTRQRRAHRWARGAATRGCPAVGTEGSGHRTPRRWGLPGKVWVRTTPPSPG